MDAFTRFTNQTQGRDRLFRATQYTCMLLRYLLEPKAGKEKVVMKLKKLETSVSTGRKWFRLGNVVHAVQATEQSIHATDLVPRLCLTLANLNRVIYFICDTILWMEQVAHNRAKREKSSSQDPLEYSVADEETEWLQSFLLLLFRSLKQHPPLLLDTVKNFCDILNPLDQLGICKSNPGIIGLGGLVSSIAGMITVAYPQMKLKTR
ncbi:peroxisomal membrane protein 11A isoform X2 [Lemur catta]|uniref:peroxisomal membrane protein 11A isoform X2 n=1 Tax=Lemur catta TaxID=9447 RepID=UPI001E26D227|nr:peroxisomal membrane protein 11A isoform X2 [Lemur catta]